MLFFKPGDEFKHNKLKMNTLVAGTDIYSENTIRIGSEGVKKTTFGALSLQRTHKNTFSHFQSHKCRNFQLFNWMFVLLNCTICILAMNTPHQDNMSNFVNIQNWMIVIFHEQPEYKLTTFSDKKNCLVMERVTIINQQHCCPGVTCLKQSG
jgi:hypothetical protein